ncbi:MULTISPECIES: NAD-dependent succinate-semialdehyde dehydrogenase [unclassified Actinomyces]|uniref:NAD-dependent succinate-semialdehyde dehydrogenase n=1 Tax=unclassified Actinomyces TaxID=2609248 RepID=UPI0020173A60|nr:MULTISPECIES: NAD-dependent succinate-semialdehyde dehydrogenase [unclassified Actinomyces]MCL3778172.1 NAD-dependent succinate-semialdehyde dehydrogenase [Actinomyces sp. AC-20-1]MCL3790040.1 NAD-dependent succinate-semialdehyde dehydrogenase [Actinomyces sp. 187325]MCL3792729.1 NAD-dependent succinate-semialdehyde dehydrogenase [Actinomyces sp. 186855]MCL3793600.1 NAD-dependent succinate-semialdehyde dehydrogenase [Actinomyces sp. 217892]
MDHTTTQDAVTDLLSRVPTGIFLNGEFTESSSGERFDVLNPATGEVLTTVASATPQDAATAMDQAVAAQRTWQFTSPRERADILRRAFELATTTYRKDLALLMTLEMGKPLAQADGEVTYGAEFLRWFAEEAVRVRGDYFRLPEGHLQAVVVRRPVGPCLLITPWNFPLAMATRKAGPALAAGNVAILKPSKDTPLTSLLFARIMSEAGLPAGVLSVLPSERNREITGPLIQDPRLRKVSFTGSTPVGRALLKEAADNVLRTSMELGGNAPFIVFEDADLDAAVEAALVTKMRNMGQACNASDHFLVHESVSEDFGRRLAEALAAQRVGDGTEEGVDIGPLVSARQRDAIAAMVDGALASGARALTGGRVPEGPGFFYPPTILVDVDPRTDIIREEIFGPIAPIVPFSTEEEVIALANDDSVGLSAYVHTTDMARVMRLAERLEFGMIGVNSATISNAAAPFGGVKQSGMGREGGKEGIEDYLETVYVGVPAPDFLP